MTETTLADVERALERAADRETKEAVSVLRTARQDGRDPATDADVDEDRERTSSTASNGGSATCERATPTTAGYSSS
ncbi:hypothetical protein HTG_15020 [Natrinema mahii]|nr:hypothetical protein HTG_15020 [Natrinema mahii]